MPRPFCRMRRQAADGHPSRRVGGGSHQQSICRSHWRRVWTPIRVAAGGKTVSVGRVSRHSSTPSCRGPKTHQSLRNVGEDESFPMHALTQPESSSSRRYGDSKAGWTAEVAWRFEVSFCLRVLRRLHVFANCARMAQPIQANRRSDSLSSTASRTDSSAGKATESAQREAAEEGICLPICLC